LNETTEPPPLMGGKWKNNARIRMSIDF